MAGLLTLATAVLNAQVTNPPPVPVERPVTIAAFAEQPPRLDGRLDDPCWKLAQPLTNFTQVLPVEGAPPTERTEVRFVYTRDQLYIGVRCFDQSPQRIIAKQMRRDHELYTDDVVTIAFDTFNRQRDGYFFAVNPLGARTDGLIQNFSETRYEWDGLWDARARIDDFGWTIEMAIPFKSLSFDPLHDAWGCNVEREIRRKQEVVRWTALSRAKSATALSDFGELRGLVDLRQGRGLELRPFVSLKYINNPAGADDWKLKPGADATWRLTPSLTANATINTDFAEAEVDDRIVNLTRFPVFFPEKRDFFLQDSSLFSFGGLDRRAPLAYHSRTIGLTADRRPVDILAGGRLTGRIGDTYLALLDVQQDSYDGVPSKNLFVGRVSTKVFEESDVGVIATHGDPRIPGDNTLLGADFNYLNSRLAGGKEVIGHAWAMGTDSDNVQSRDGAFGIDLDFPNEPWSANVFARQVGENFDPALGFVPRSGIRNYLGMMEYIWRPNTAWLRRVSVHSRWEWFTDLDNRIVTEDTDPVWLSFESPSGDEIELTWGFDRDVLDEDFEIQDNIIIPPGDYWDGHVLVGFDTSAARPVGLSLSYRNGGFYTGNKQDYEAEIDWRPSRHLTASAGYELAVVHLPEGNFNVHLITCRLNVGFTPDLTWHTLVQYDNDSDDLGVNSRVRWTWRPGNDLFFVVNPGWAFEDWRFRQLQTEVTLKVGATFRF